MNRLLAEHLVNQRRPIFWISLFIVALFAIGGKNVYLESDYKAFFSADNPQLVAHNLIQNTYTDTDNIFFVIEPKEGGVFNKDVITAIASITKSGWEVPFSVRVDSITNYQHSYPKADELVVEDLLSIENLSDSALAKAKKIATHEPQLVNNIISPDASISAVNVMLAMPKKADIAVREVIQFAREIKSNIESKHPSINIYLQGTAAVNHAFIESSEKDAASLMPLMFVVILIILFIWLRSTKATFITLLVINLSTAVALGFCGWAGIALNQVNVIAPTVIMTLAICDCVHILVTYLENLASDKSPEAAMAHSLDINLQPIFITSLTTAIGFLCINFSESPPLAEMGTITAVGVVAAFILSLSTLPFLCIKFIRVSKGVAPGTSSLMKRFSTFVIAKQTPIFFSVLILSTSLAAILFNNDIDDNYIKYFSHNTDIRQGAEITQSRLTGIDTVSYSFDQGHEGGVSEPEFLHAISDFVSWCREQPEVVHVGSYIDIIKRLNQNMHNDDPRFYQIPDNKQLAAQYLLLYGISLPFGLELNNIISFDNSSLLVNLRLRVDKAKEIIAFDERAQTWIKQNHPALETNGASVSLMFAHLGKSNISNMIYGNIVGILLISLTLVFALRSFKYGVISVLPNVMPAAVALGLWGAFSGEVNIAVAVVFSVTLGIVVDDTVHFLSKYVRGRRTYGYSAEESVQYAFETVGKSLIITSVVLAIGFFILALSDFTVNSSMGLMVGLTIFIALAFDFLFLPTLLLKLDNEK